VVNYGYFFCWTWGLFLQWGDDLLFCIGSLCLVVVLLFLIFGGSGVWFIFMLFYYLLLFLWARRQRAQSWRGGSGLQPNDNNIIPL
jgi:hypothetical protein